MAEIDTKAEERFDYYSDHQLYSAVASMGGHVKRLQQKQS